MRKFVTELKGIVSKTCVSTIFLDVVSKVRNAVTAPIPSFSIGSNFICTLSHLFRIYTDFHSKIEKRIWLGKIIDVELDGHSFEGVFDLEEEPLSVTVGVYVVLHQQIVL